MDTDASEDDSDELPAEDESTKPLTAVDPTEASAENESTEGQSIDTLAEEDTIVTPAK